MTDDLPPFPVDAVLTWVDSSDAAWRRRYEEVVGRPFEQNARWSPPSCEPDDELALCLELLRRHAPWLRRTFLVTQGQVPPCRTSEVLVSHAELGLDPVFSSFPIESALHRIDGLAEHFVYLNDDFYVTRPVRWQHFFGPDGVPIARVGPNPETSAFQALNDRTAQLYGHPTGVHLYHVPYALTKTAMDRAERAAPYNWSVTRTLALRYQDEREINPVLAATLHALRTGGVRSDDAGALKHRFYEGLPHWGVRLSNPHVVCINGLDGDSRHLRAAVVHGWARARLIVLLLSVVTLAVVARVQRGPLTKRGSLRV